MTNLTIYANTGASDVALNTSGYSGWVEIDTTNDSIIFSAGSDTVADGEAIPSDSQLTQAGIVYTGSEITVDDYFLSDYSANQLKDIDNMGAGDYQYVLAFSFDGATASEPVLEVWDDSDLDSIANTSLGGGVASSSWVRGITTTTSSAGASWVGSTLAGSSDGHFLWLNDENGALSTADVLYCQLKIVIPATQTTSVSEAPVFAVKYTST